MATELQNGADYKQMYHILFNAVTDALRMMEQERFREATAMLTAAQCQAEEYYIIGAD